ncbi:uncharacterized protein N0V89_001711 [Didymosphaeria variabile]|uniref:Cytochrome P450 n=1 Tax=Didymosphaeria variabile TaxID=1932322 RepID=A0A9W8XQR5_9PLEO|nr:uncharacterized protein N0V89_001711 [Didymosphaeria variabile]KAJ4357136.1 hypothetical protein N0V89_001711 [Didymosphaeria variabile]
MEDGKELVIMNDRLLKELKSLPDDILSAEVGINQDMLYKYSHVKVVDPVGQNAIRSDLTPGLPRLMPTIASEARAAINAHFPHDAESWVPVVVFPVVLDSVAQVSARLFVGAELCRDPRWLKCSQTAAIAAFATISAMKRFPAWLRPMAQYFVPEKVQLEKARAEAIRILREDSAHKVTKSSGEGKEDYLVTWIEKKNAAWAKDFVAQANLQLELSVAAIHTTTMALTHVLYDLATHPEYIEILRDEVKAALSKTGGVYNKDCIASMAKTDSFMKESQRLHPPALTTFKRRVMRDFTLSDGTHLPKGTSIEVDASARYHDLDSFEDPDQFDGMRFLRISEQTQQKSAHQYVASNQDYVFWGQGKHACPGRFFAANEIKTLLAMFILDYNVKLPPGVERPADIHIGTFVSDSKVL